MLSSLSSVIRRVETCSLEDNGNRFLLYAEFLGSVDRLRVERHSFSAEYRSHVYTVDSDTDTLALFASCSSV